MTVIRLATPQDAATINGQRRAMFLDMGEDPARLEPMQEPSLAWHRRALESGVYIGFLAEAEGERVGGKIVGDAGILWQDMPPNPDTLLSTRAYIMNVYVRPDARGRG